MRDLTKLPVGRFRRRDADVMRRFGTFGDARHGAFFLPKGISLDGYKSAASLACVASASEGWDHVSVSARKRVPTWDEMMLAHRLFFAADEVAVQYCVPATDHISHHPFVLHLWRPHDAPLPMPPPLFV